MRHSFRSTVLFMLATACLLSSAFAPSSMAATPPQGDDQTANKPKTTHTAKPKATSSSSEIKELKDAIAAQQQQIQQLQQQIQNRDQAIQQVKNEADQDAAEAKQSAATAQQAAAAAAKANEYDTQDAAAMSTLHSSVVDLEAGTKANTEGLAAAKTSLVKLEKPYQVPPSPTVVPAIAPVRVLSLDPPKKEGLTPGIMLGGVTVTPYGFVKATMAYDSLDPTGDDFPRPAFTAADTGPNSNPEFHVKARASRVGTRIEWPDVSKNITITGQIEADFEGNFSRADNRNVSSIRSNALQLRLAYGRIDWNVRPNTDIFFEGGQDWSIFGSSALMNLFETTFYGAYWGNLYERTPQFRLGVVEKLGGSRNWRLSPEVAVMMPSEGNLPADAVTSACTTTSGLVTTCTNTVVNGLGNQLGYGERQGADWGRPEVESRVVLQFQLDKAPGVVPAQVLWSGFYSGRQATVLASAVPLDTAVGADPKFYQKAFPRGADKTSNGYGNQLAVSLPTRWFTIVASGYEGADLRFFFGGETLSNYTQAGGLTATANGFSVDRSSTVVFGTNAAGQAVTAPQLPVRGYGGFVQAGFPISRWFNADPKGRNAGWQAYVEYGIDAANANDFRYAKDIGAAGGGPIKDTLKAVTVFYKMNPWVQFGFEEGKYTGYALPNNSGLCTTKVAGLPTCTSTDWRSEFGPIFTF
jgi:hypothetical protein